jgi:MFS family permease
MTSDRVQRTYVALVVLQTLAASLIWGVNTLFLLDAGLTLTGAFIANAAFTAGMVLFEVPTGVVADVLGRRASYLLGSGTLLVTTLLYLLLWWLGASLGWWIVVSALIGLGFTFFSGATEAWLVDALKATGFKGEVDVVFGRAAIGGGAAMLIGTLVGGVLGQVSLGLPYVVRSALFLVVIVVAATLMRDLGFTRAPKGNLSGRVRQTLRESIKHGLGNPPVRMFMLAAPFSGGVVIWAFYAFPPHLLDLFGDESATWLAGAAAAIFAAAQIIGGASVKLARRVFSTRTAVLALEVVASAVGLVGVGLASRLPHPWGFAVALALLAVTALGWAVSKPLQQAYLNEVIPSEQRATVLSFASLMDSLGGVAGQPGLGRVADVWSLGTGYVVAGAIMVVRLPFVLAVRAMKLPADEVKRS